MGNEQTTVADILAEAERIKRYLRDLGYDSVSTLGHELFYADHIQLCFNCTDDFQKDTSYEAKKQHGVMSIRYGSGDETKLLNREQRELHVLLAQQGESTAIAGMLVSAAGKRFTDVIHAERAKYAQLVDFSNE